MKYRWNFPWRPLESIIYRCRIYTTFAWCCFGKIRSPAGSNFRGKCPRFHRKKLQDQELLHLPVAKLPLRWSQMQKVIIWNNTVFRRRRKIAKIALFDVFVGFIRVRALTSPMESSYFTIECSIAETLILHRLYFLFEWCL